MDTTKHTVTVPIADYEEMKNNNPVVLAEAFSAHIQAMADAGVIIHKERFSVGRIPKRAIVRHDNSMGGNVGLGAVPDRIIIAFEY